MPFRRSKDEWASLKVEAVILLFA
jgi:hypothetical protein